jgi:cysteine synthase A
MLVTLICDHGERYAGSYYNDNWLADQGPDLAGYERAIEAFLLSGIWRLPHD